jgi:hypothetical protein
MLGDRSRRHPVPGQYQVGCPPAAGRFDTVPPITVTVSAVKPGSFDPVGARTDQASIPPTTTPLPARLAWQQTRVTVRPTSVAALKRARPIALQFQVTRRLMPVTVMRTRRLVNSMSAPRTPCQTSRSADRGATFPIGPAEVYPFAVHKPGTTAPRALGLRLGWEAPEHLRLRLLSLQLGSLSVLRPLPCHLRAPPHWRRPARPSVLRAVMVRVGCNGTTCRNWTICSPVLTIV